METSLTNHDGDQGVRHGEEGAEAGDDAGRASAWARDRGVASKDKLRLLRSYPLPDGSQMLLFERRDGSAG